MTLRPKLRFRFTISEEMAGIPCVCSDGKRLYMIRRDGGTIFYADYDFNTKAFVDKPQVLPVQKMSVGESYRMLL